MSQIRLLLDLEQELQAGLDGDAISDVITGLAAQAGSILG